MLRTLALTMLAVLAQPAMSEPPAVTVTTARMAVLRDTILVTGLVGAVEQVQVQPLIEGQPVETLEADVGDTVAAGQVLARLSPATLDLQRAELLASQASAEAAVAQSAAQLAEARANAQEARRVATRTEALRTQGTAAQAATDTAEANAVSAEARVNAATQSLRAAQAQVTLATAQLANIDLQLSRTAVTAPVAGEVVERNAVIGAIASAQGNPMFTLTRDGALELRADVTEADLLRLSVGQTARLTPVSGPPIAGQVRLIEPRVDEASRLGRVRISVDDPQGLRPGMFAEAEILLAETEALTLPLTALGRDADGSFVMLVEGGTVRRAAVTPGIRDGGMVGVIGIAKDSRVVTRAAAFVREGDAITAVEAAR